MITFHSPDAPAVTLTAQVLCCELTRTAIWIDVLEPTQEEERTLEAALGIDIPTREEVQEIELSSRLFEEKGILFMTATVLSRADTSAPLSSTVTFVLAGERLLTLRYEDPLPFQTFRRYREANLHRYQTNTQFLGGLVEAIIERVADILEGVGVKLDSLSVKVFEPGRAENASLPHGSLGRSARGEARKRRAT